MNKKIKFCFSQVALLSLFFLFFPITAQAKKLFVPFTSQAPFGDWRQPWQDACEEATIFMVDQFYSGKQITQEGAKSGIRQILNIKKNSFGHSLDENASTIVNIINNFHTWEAYIVENPTIEMIKKEIDSGQPVILPTHGKYLKNPYFLSGGPDYHTLVISGYNDEKQIFITQEPGTRHGLDFEYNYDTLMNAMHDLVPQRKTKDGEKKAIFTRKIATDYLKLDGDNDGLTKELELQYGTILWLSDSDGDGYTDGEEVSSGYSPVKANYQPKTGDLVMESKSPKVYLIEKNMRRHITSELVFKKHGWLWSQIKIIDNTILNKIQEGSTLSI